ncbi:MAG TPA: TRAM domain-containing protein [Patescibacteria group bacterium]|nr:TRAM domain-containing protein [Patescibacteria group bacterium]
MFWQVAVRAILGVALAGIGYFLINQWLPPINLLGSTKTLPTLVILTLGAIGVFLVPAVSAVAKRLFFSFVRLLARELLALIPFPRLGRPERAPVKIYHNPMILDTSAIIDGRIAEIAKTGFLDGTLLVPKFILGELQHIADSADPIRRSRGRRGFEVIEELGNIGGDLKLEVSDLDFPKIKKADDKLLQIGKKLKAKVVTTDYNLNKVGKLSGVRILNVNELANSIKTVLIPGEKISVKVMQVGKEQGQGVGYLPDGTMIVVEGGSKMLGQVVETEVSRVFQTVAGRMIFVKPKKV